MDGELLGVAPQDAFDFLVEIGKVIPHGSGFFVVREGKELALDDLEDR